MSVPTLHIHQPHGWYVSQVHRRGARLWTTVSDRHRSAKSAMARAIKHMDAQHNRARVLFCAEWYDPVVVMRLSK